MKRIFKTLIVALCFTAAACTTDYQVDIDDLNDRIDSLEKNQIASITQQIASINTTLPQLSNTSAELKGMIESMKQTIQDYRDVVVNNEAKLAALKAEIEGEIVKLRSDIEKSQDADKKEMLAALKATQAELEGQLDAIRTEAAAKEKQMEESLKLLEEKDASLTDRIDELQTFVTDELASAKSYNEKTYATLAQQQLIEYDIAAIKTSIEDLEDSMTELETRLTENYTTAIEKATESLNTAIENATQSLNEKINSWASALITGYTNAISKAKLEITTAYENKIKESIDALRTEVKKWVNEQLELYYTAAQMDTKLAGLKTDLEGQLAAQKAYLEKADSVLRADFEADDDVLDSLIKVNAAAIKANEEAIKANKAAIDKINDETLPALKDEITKAYQKAITDGIAAACKENGVIDKRIDELIGANNLRLLDMYIKPMQKNITALQDSVKVLREDITKLSEKIQAVSDKLDGFINGRIQSLTYIPVSADGQFAVGMICTNVYGDLVMKFQVNPVSMAKDITIENISAKASYLDPNKDNKQYYESVKVKDVAVDEQTGVLTVTMAAADVFNPRNEDGGEILEQHMHRTAVSVSVKDIDTKHNEVYYDVASEFVYVNAEHFFLKYTTSASADPKNEFFAYKFRLNTLSNSSFNDYEYEDNSWHLLGHNFIYVGGDTKTLNIQLAKDSEHVNNTVTSIDFGEIWLQNRYGVCEHRTDYVKLYTGANAFSNCPQLDSVDMLHLNVTSVKSFSSMFENDSALKGVYIDGGDVDNVTTVAKMFKNCKSLEKVNLKGWATENITDFSEMFAYCTKLELADQNWSSFNQSTAVNFSGMFRGTAITKVDFKDLNVKVNSLQNMFNGCTALKTVTLAGDTQNSKTLDMVSGAVYGTETSTTADLGHMFDGCTALTSVVLSDLKFTEMPDFEYMFNNCTKLETITFENWNIETDFTAGTYDSIVESMFSNCSNLKEVKMKGSTEYAYKLIEKALGKVFGEKTKDILKINYN